MLDRRVEITPPWPYRLPRTIGREGVMVRRREVLHRLVHVGDEPVVVRAAQPARDRVVIGAEGATVAACDAAIARMRFAIGVDEDLRAFHARFRSDPLIGPVVRASPWIRPMRRPEPFEALAWAICEQLIDYPRAADIQRRIVRRLGRRCERTGLWDVPRADVLAAQAPAFYESCDLAARRALTLVRCAREVASGRVDLHSSDHESGWRRLRKISGVGTWTIDILAYHGQGRMDMVPAGDLNLVKLVGRVRSGGDPSARATEDEVRAFFAPYGEWAALAATFAARARPGESPRSDRTVGPRRAGTRSSALSWDPPAA
jgi:3-methyladenine DNA glycosylase/8-oxoguanine DNA glycosylase